MRTFHRLMSSNYILCVRYVAMFIYYASIARKQYLDIYMYLLCCNIDLVICFSTTSHCSLWFCMYMYMITMCMGRRPFCVINNETEYLPEERLQYRPTSFRLGSLRVINTDIESIQVK